MPKKKSSTHLGKSRAAKTSSLTGLNEEVQKRDWLEAAYHELAHATVAAVLGGSCIEIYLGVRDQPLNGETKSVAGSCRYLALDPAQEATVAWAGIIGEFLHNDDSDLDDFDLYTDFLDGRLINPPSPTDQAMIDKVPVKKRESTCEAAWKLTRKHWRDIEKMALACQKAFSHDDGFYAYVEFDGKRVSLRSKY